MFSRASGGDASSCVPRRRAEGAPRHDPPPPPESDGSNGPLSPSLRAGGGHSGWQPRRVVHIPFTVTRDAPIWAAATAPWWCGGTLRPPLAKPSRCRVLPCALGTCAGPLGVYRSATTHTDHLNATTCSRICLITALSSHPTAQKVRATA